eukprot:4340167-Amphidinium_carterae.1
MPGVFGLGFPQLLQNSRFYQFPSCPQEYNASEHRTLAAAAQTWVNFMRYDAAAEKDLSLLYTQ